MSTYSNVVGHRSMALDSVRNQAYADAIEALLRPDSVVLDLGAGLGIHGLIAAARGARHVYLVDPSPVLTVAQKVAAASGLSSKVTFIQKPIEQADLPEQVDLILSVFTGNFLLEEDLLPSLFYARDRYLKMSGVMVPDCAEMRITPVNAAEYYQKNVDCWSHPMLDIDFKPVRSYAVNSLFYDAASYREAEFLAPPVTLASLDFTSATKAECSNTVRFEMEKAGDCHGFLGWFRMRLGSQWISTSPLKAAMHWSQVFLPLGMPLKVKAGDVVTLRLVRPQFGDWSWICEHAGKTQTQSSFFSRALTMDQLRCGSQEYQAELNAQGQLTHFVLDLMNGLNPNSSIIAQSKERFGKEFASPEELVKRVQAIIKNFGK